jgi:transposase
VKQIQKPLEHSRFERKFQQLTLPMDMEITIPQEDPVRLVSAQLEELYRAYSSRGRKSSAERRHLASLCLSVGSTSGFSTKMPPNVTPQH